MGFKNFTPAQKSVVDGGGNAFNLNFEQVGANFYQMSSPYRAGETQEPVRQLLDTVGDGTGVVNANGNYLTVQEQFRLTPAPGVVLRVHELIISIQDGIAGGAFTSTNFGDIAALTTGMGIAQETGDGTAVVKELMSGVKIKNNAMLANLGASINMIAWKSDGLLQATFNFQRIMGEPLRIDGTANDELIIRLDDNLTGLTGLHFMASGYVE